jgi:hypothetical protein
VSGQRGGVLRLEPQERPWTHPEPAASPAGPRTEQSRPEQQRQCRVAQRQQKNVSGFKGWPRAGKGVSFDCHPHDPKAKGSGKNRRGPAGGDRRSRHEENRARQGLRGVGDSPEPPPQNGPAAVALPDRSQALRARHSLNRIAGEHDAVPGPRDESPEQEVFGQIVAKRQKATDCVQGGAGDEDRLSDDAGHLDDPDDGGRGRPENAVEIQRFEPRSGGRRARGEEQVRNQTHRRVGEPGDRLGQEIARHPHVAVGEEEVGAPRAAQSRREPIDLRIAARLAGVHDEHRGHTLVAVRDAAGHRECRIGFRGERENDLEGRVVQLEEGLEVLLELGVQAREGLHDRDGRQEARPHRRAGSAAVSLERDDRGGVHGRAEKEAGEKQQRQGHAVAEAAPGARRRTPIPVARRSASRTPRTVLSAGNKVFQA